MRGLPPRVPHLGNLITGRPLAGDRWERAAWAHGAQDRQTGPRQPPPVSEPKEGAMAGTGGAGRPRTALRRALLPLALAQFICSFAGSNMNVMINDISKALDTTVKGVQVAITIFLLVMAALMIPGGKLTDRWGRTRCFTIGLTIYGVGALMSAA